MPDFSIELESGMGRGRVVCGIDEVGRGPLAGPVTAAAAILDPETLPESLRLGLDDSKKLSAKKREMLFVLLSDCPTAQISIAHASVAEIDTLNILRATHLAMQRAVAGLRICPHLALIDGNQAPRDFPCPTRTVIKGDGLSLSIAAASIAAKVTRDRLMADLAQQYPGYGWEHNSGYGTAEHRLAIAKQGLTEHHRRSFACQGELFDRVGV